MAQGKGRIIQNMSLRPEVNGRIGALCGSNTDKSLAHKLFVGEDCTVAQAAGIVDKLNSPTEVELYAAAFAMWAKGYTPQQAAEVLGKKQHEVTDAWSRFDFPNINRSAALRYSALGKVDLTREQHQQLLEDHLREVETDQPIITMGTTPSGPLTLANVYTFLAGIEQVQEACKSLGKAPVYKFGVNDNLPTIKDPDNVAARVGRIEEFIDDLRRHYGIDITVTLMSDMQKEREFRNLVGDVAQATQTSMKVYIKGEEIKEYRQAAIFSRDDDLLRDEIELSFDLETGIVLRTVYQGSNVHIIGGDQNHDAFNTKIYTERKRPHILRLGVLYGQDGKEMHVSNGNTITLDEIKEQYNNWLEQVIALTKGVTPFPGPFEYQHLIPLERRNELYGINLAGEVK